jgi:hypothetical protein
LQFEPFALGVVSGTSCLFLPFPQHIYPINKAKIKPEEHYHAKVKLYFEQFALVVVSGTSCLFLRV